MINICMHIVIWFKNFYQMRVESWWRDGKSAELRPKSKASSNTSCAIIFIFGLISLEKYMNPLSLQQWFKYYHCCSSGRMHFTLNKL